MNKQAACPTRTKDHGCETRAAAEVARLRAVGARGASEAAANFYLGVADQGPRMDPVPLSRSPTRKLEGASGTLEPAHASNKSPNQTAARYRKLQLALV